MTRVKGQVILDALVIAGLLLKFTIVKVRGPNKSLQPKKDQRVSMHEILPAASIAAHF